MMIDFVFKGESNIRFTKGNIYQGEKVRASYRIRPDHPYQTSDGWGWFNSLTLNDLFDVFEGSLENE